MKMKLMILALIFTVNIRSIAQNYPFEYQKTGNGEKVIVFIPGFASSGAVWDETVSQLKDRFTCYVLTMPGFAGVKAEQNPTLAGWSEGIANFIENKIRAKVTLVGHSLGAGLAMTVSADHPDLIEKLVMVDGLPYLAGLFNPNAKPNVDNDCSGIISQIEAMSDEQFDQMQKLSATTMTTSDSYKNIIVNWSKSSDRYTFAKIFCDFNNTDLRDRLQTIDCPSLVLLEANFKSFKNQVENQFGKLKNVNFQYADKGLHFIMYDDPEWFFNQLVTFLNQ